MPRHLEALIGLHLVGRVYQDQDGAHSRLRAWLAPRPSQVRGRHRLNARRRPGEQCRRSLAPTSRPSPACPVGELAPRKRIPQAVERVVFTVGIDILIIRGGAGQRRQGANEVSARLEYLQANGTIGADGKTPQRPRLGFRALIRKNQALAAKPSSRIQSSCCFPVEARPPGLLVPSPEELLVLYFSRRRKIRSSFGSDKRTSARRRERLSSPLAFRQ